MSGASPKRFPAELREPRIGAEGIGLGVHADVEQRVGLFFTSPLELLKCFVPPAQCVQQQRYVVRVNICGAPDPPQVLQDCRGLCRTSVPRQAASFIGADPQRVGG